MNNTYYLMRHGHSEANEQGIITCDPAVCTTEYGLTEKGRAQVTSAAAKISKHLKDTPVIITSDFLRALQTAEIIAAKLGTKVSVDKRLRERDFSILHGQPDDNYLRVWAITDNDPDAKPEGVESDSQIVTRVELLLSELEKKYTKREIILVSHGDPLNIISAQHIYGTTTEQTHTFQNAEIRPLLTLAPSVTIES